MDDVTCRAELSAKYNLTDTQSENLQIYVDLLRKWQKKINLVSKSTVKQVWQRHIEDSLQLAPILKQITGGERKKLMDMGCGAGFPGLVLAIIDVAEISLVESDLRKCLFMKEVARQTDTDVTVVNNRIEKADITDVDIVSARALASLDDLCSYAYPFLANDGKCLFSKGEKADLEIAAARKNWQFDVETVPSQTSSEAQILILSGLKPQ